MKSVQTSESIKLGAILALAGGFMDAYSYIGRGGVFANAETGNIVLLAISIGNRNPGDAVRYIFQIASFAVGVLISQTIKYKKKNAPTFFHWRQDAIFFEIIAMVIAGFISKEYDIVANSLISLTCGIQVVAFAKISGHSISTTMCTGNLRIGTQNLSMYFATKDKIYYQKGIFYYGCILMFIIGAIVGDFFTRRIGEKSVLLVALMLFTAYTMMFFNEEEKLDNSSEIVKRG